MLRRWCTGRLVNTARQPKHFQWVERRFHIVAQKLSDDQGNANQDGVPLRKQLKQAARVAKKQEWNGRSELELKRQQRLAEWELTVGIEIHAQLNTSTKLFSQASAEYTDTSNAALWPFDLAVPGSQPLFQPAVLVPALRAAIALNCKPQIRSKFDRKHYFYHDQPAGYQITQYYEPFAVDGHITLTKEDGLECEGKGLTIGIKQIQLEQDTAKTQEQDDETSLIDFNRSGQALVEIISLPQIHSPQAAAAYVRKVQSILYAIDAATTGMELGGLRADVNVSVRKVGTEPGNHSYSGVKGLGQRTEIKNLSSFKSVEDAVRAEMNRQIDLLEAGGSVEGETRGWSLSSPGVTRRLRGKEGEVDYRYMPDPDIAPLYIHPELVNHFRNNLPPLPEELKDMLQTTYGLTPEDAKALLSLDSGERLLYFQEVVALLKLPVRDKMITYGVQVGNWILHEFGALLTTSERQWTSELVNPQQMADLITLHVQGQLTGPSAKQLLRILVDGDKNSAIDIASRENLLFMPMAAEEYSDLADKVINEHPTEANTAREGGRQAKGKLKFLLGQMMRLGDRNRIEALNAENTLKAKLFRASQSLGI